MEKIKTITSSIAEHFDNQVNEFTLTKGIVITNHKIHTVANGKHTIHTAYFYYLTEEDYKRYLELKQQQENTANKPQPVKKKRVKAKTTTSNNVSNQPKIVKTKEPEAELVS